MSDESTSNLVDVTFQALHGMLAGHVEVPSVQKLEYYLELRAERFRKCTNPFSPPSAESRAKVESGTVVLGDGSKIKVDTADKPFIWAISKRFMLDEVDSLVLLRSFLYNQGLPDDADAENLVEELGDAITPFYFSERLSIIRCYIPLLRAKDKVDDPFHEIATKFLDKVLDKPNTLVDTLIKEYVRRTQQELPPEIARDISVATVWAKQVAREQLAMVEVIFWLMWNLVPELGPVVFDIFKAAYDTDLGRKQKYSALLLEEEGLQLLNDIESVWLVLLPESLNLDYILDDDSFQLLEQPQDARTVLTSPQHLVLIHGLVMGTNNSRYSPIVLAWACVLFRLYASAGTQDEIPPNYDEIVNRTSVVPESDPPIPLYQHLLMWVLHPDIDVLRRIEALLTKSALFVSSLAWSTGSALTDPNAIAFRLVIKGLLIGVCEMCRTEFIPDFSVLVDAWVALFGAGDPNYCAPLALQYWVEDWPRNARRQPLDVARARFPVQFRPLVRMLAALARNRECATYAYHFLNTLPSFTHVITIGPDGLYEADPDSTAWTNTRQLVFPGGIVVPSGSVGHVVGGDGRAGVPVVMKLDYVYSGWSLLRDVIAEVARAKAMRAAGKGMVHTSSPLGTFSVREIGIELGEGEEDALIIDTLSLFLNIVKHEPDFITVLMSTLEATSQHVTSPNIVQLTIVILEDALIRASAAKERLVTVCMEVLTALLPIYPNRVWPYLKTTTQMFGSEAQVGATPALLTAERIAGQYPMTRALIALVRAMLDDALPRAGSNDTPEQFRGIKEKVLLRALHLIHAEVWLEHAGWRFRELGDRFEIARSIIGLYMDILRSGKGALVDFVLRVFLNDATHASVGPLVTPIAAGQQLLEGMYKARRFAEARGLILLIEALLKFSRLIIVRKPDPQLPCLLEHSFFSAGPGRRVPVDYVMNYVTSRDLGARVPVEAVALLQTLCSSPTGFTLARYLADPVATAEAMVRIVNHPYDDPVLRNALWRFMAVAVDSQPAFAGLFVAGTFSIPDVKDGQKKDQENEKPPVTPRSTKTTALDAAIQTTNNWTGIWESNPELLSSALGFLDVVWQHALEHKPALEATRRNAHFAEILAGIALAEAGQAPTMAATRITLIDGRIVSDVHDIVASHVHRVIAKSRALHILALDVNVDPPGVTAKGKGSETHSLRRLLDLFADESKLRGQVALAAANSYIPDLHASLVADIAVAYPTLTLDRVADEQQRQFGDGYLFDVDLLHSRLTQDFNGQQSEQMAAESVLVRTCSVNLNWSLADAETAFTQSWCQVVRLISPSLRDDATITACLLGTAVDLATDVAIERRSGRVMAIIHTERLGLLLALLETIWFVQTLPQQAKDKENIVNLVSVLESLVSSEVFPPKDPLFDRNAPQYHIPLVQIIYICVRMVRRLLPPRKAPKTPKPFKLEQHLTFKSVFTVCMGFTVGALGILFDLIGTGFDPDISRGIELLVAVFGQCIQPEIELWSASWLGRCQETNIVHTTLQLLTRINLRGSFEETVSARHIMEFYVALSSNSSGAERLALEGALPAFCNNGLTPLLSAGGVDATVDRSSAHWIWCSMLSVITSILSNSESGSRVAEDAIGFVQVCGAQLERVLSWQVEEPLTLAYLEELELVIGFFYSFAQAHCSADDDIYRGDPGVGHVARGVLRAYAQRALLLLQHLNYAVTHQKHLESLVEPASAAPPRADLVNRFLAMIEKVLATLSVVSASDMVFLRRSADWPVTNDIFIIAAISKTQHASASFGTLFETATCVVDIVKNNPSAAVSLDVIEVVLTFATSQFALWAGRRERDPDSVSSESLREIKSDLVKLLSDTRRALEQSKLEGAATAIQLVGGMNRFVSNIVQ